MDALRRDNGVLGPYAGVIEDGGGEEDEKAHYPSSSDHKLLTRRFVDKGKGRWCRGRHSPPCRRLARVCPGGLLRVPPTVEPVSLLPCLRVHEVRPGWE